MTYWSFFKTYYHRLKKPWISLIHSPKSPLTGPNLRSSLPTQTLGMWQPRHHISLWARLISHIWASTHLSQAVRVVPPQLPPTPHIKKWWSFELDEPTITIMGRIATIKMIILRKINNQFSNIPVHLTATWFKSLDSTISKFYWENKTPRIKLTTLQNSKTQAGLEAPYFSQYFLANQL